MNSKSKVDEILEQRKIQEKNEAEETAKLKDVCKLACEDTNVKFLLKYLKKICLWNDQSNDITPNIAVYNKGRRDIWAIFRNVIPLNVLADIEIYDR